MAGSNSLSPRELLGIVFSFFPRVEAKLTFLFGVNVALLGLAFVNLALDQLVDWYSGVPLIVFLVLIAFSYAEIYRATFPDLAGGENSLIYFKEIAGRTELDFVEEYKTKSSTDLDSDVLAQVWRNSQILTEKYKRLQDAFRYTLYSVLFLSIYVVVTAIQNDGSIKV